MLFRLAIDIDGVITETPFMFECITNIDAIEIHIVTGRPASERESTIAYLNTCNIRYDKLAFVSPKEIDADSKVTYCIDNKIDAIIDDDDHYLDNMPQSIVVLKVRNNSNYDFGAKIWKSIPRI